LYHLKSVPNYWTKVQKPESLKAKIFSSE